MSNVFVSYRRSDSQGWAGRLGEEFARAFGEVARFLDLESIEPGDDFVAAIERSLAECEVVVVLIGPRWLSAAFADGRRRLDDPGDFVRLEIAAALARGLRVLPVLLGGATMPGSESLPAELAGLARRQAFELSDSRWEHDCGRLLDAIERTTSLERVRSTGAESGGSIAVAEGLVLEDSDAGDIAGVKGAASPGTGGPTGIAVAKGAKVRNSKVGDIVGVKSTAPPRRRK